MNDTELVNLLQSRRWGTHYGLMPYAQVRSPDGQVICTPREAAEREGINPDAPFYEVLETQAN
jgi:hypothetical protein